MKTLLAIAMALFSLVAMPQHHRKTTHSHNRRTHHTTVRHTGKAHKAKTATAAPSTQTAAPAAQEGIASFYAKVVKSKMANGQRYHKDSMICAHRTHPFGTLLKVTNLRNNKIAIVKVTDRGPFSRGRIIDLSYGAAEKLGFISSGLTKVRVEVYDGHVNSEIDTHPTDSTDLLIDYNNREEYEFPYIPTEKKEPQE
jgi:rare lipoprotein A